MRNALRPYIGRPAQFRGTLERIGQHHSQRPTLLVRHLRDARGRYLCAHIWIVVPRLPPHGLRAGDTLEFRACARLYQRADGVEDYGLRDVDRLRVVNSGKGGAR